MYSQCAELFQVGDGQEHRLEAFAHLGRGERVEALRHVFRYVDGTLDVDAGWRTHIDQMIQRDRRPGGQRSRQPVPCRIGELLLELVADIRRRSEHDTLCVGGGLFYNTYFTTLIRMSGIFDHVFVPSIPGMQVSRLAHR